MAHNRRQKQKHDSSDNNKITRRLRIMYTDPDATDSSSDENYQKPKKIKRIVQELPFPNINIDEISSGSCEDLNKDNKLDVKRQSTSKYRGVRMRKWGSWASEIRNPMIKSGREWIGTFSTPEEASQAYEKRFLEIREEMANAEKMKNSGNNKNNNVNVIMATNQEKSSNDCFVSSDSLDDSKRNTMSQTPSSQLPELNTSDCNSIDVGNVSSNEAVEANVLGGEFAKLGGEITKLKNEFAKLDRADLSVFNMQPLPLPPPPSPDVRAANPCQVEFDCFRIDGFGDGHEYDHLGGLEDIKISGIDDKDPYGIPGFDFPDFGVDDITYGIEEPLFL